MRERWVRRFVVGIVCVGVTATATSALAAPVEGGTNGRHLALGHAREWQAVSPQASARLIRAAVLRDRLRRDHFDADLRIADLRRDGERASHRRDEPNGRWGRAIAHRPTAPSLPGGAPTNPIPEPTSILLFVVGGGIVLEAVRRKTA